MHPYSSSCDSRVKWAGAIGAVSVPCAYFFSKWLRSSGLDALWYIDYPSVLGIFALLFGAFELVLWRAFRWARVLSTPVLVGTWDVIRRSSHDQFQSKWTGTVTIRQTWTRVAITLQTANSASRSLSASVFGYGHLTEVSYEYLNEPNAASAKTMQAHRGVARLRLEAPDKLVGDYFSGRGRGEYGELELKRRKSG